MGRAARSVVHVLVEVFDREVVGGKDVERVAVNLAVATDSQVRRRDERVVLVHVLVSSLVEELTLDDARVLLRGLVDSERVIGQIERDDESAVNVLGHARVEPRCETKYARRVVHSLEEVNLGLLRHETVHLALGVLLVTKAVVGGHLTWHRLGRLLELDGAQRELNAVARAVELLCEGVDTLDLISASVGVDVRVGRNLVAGQVVVTDEVLAWLVNVHAVGELLSAEEDSEAISAVVRAVAFTDFESIIGQVVVHDVWQVLAFCEESQYLAIVVKELFLCGNLTATELLLEELKELGVLLHWNGLLALGEVVDRAW